MTTTAMAMKQLRKSLCSLYSEERERERERERGERAVYGEDMLQSERMKSTRRDVADANTGSCE